MQPRWMELMVRPEGNDRYVRNAPKNPKETRWMYDDDVSPLSHVGPPAHNVDCIRACGVETCMMMTIMTLDCIDSASCVYI